MITPIYNRTSSDCRMTADDMNRICANINEICGGSLRTNWTSNDIVDETTWYQICDLAASLGRYSITYDTDYYNVNNIERSLFDQYDDTHHITATAKLTALAISNGTLSPVFNSSTYSYTATVSELTSIVTAATDYSAIGYKVNGVYVDPEAIEWQPGTNTLQVTATLNGVTKTYTVTVTCTYQMAELTSLTIGGTSITVADFMEFATDNATDSVAYTANGSATLTLNGVEVTGNTLAWQENSNTLEITVEADNTVTYTVDVTCTYQAPVPGIVVAINITDAILTPKFSPETTAYYVYPNGDTSTITAIFPEDVEGTVYFNGVAIVNGSEIEWDEDGGDIITVVTTASDAYTSMTYTVTGRTAIIAEPLAPMRAGEFYAADPLPGEGFGE